MAVADLQQARQLREGRDMQTRSPQKEDGFTAIANELLDAILQFGFSKRQMAVVLGLIRKTYGFNKTEDDITITQLANVSGLSRQNVSKTISELVDLGAVSKRDGKHGYLLKINKNYAQWGVSKQDTPGTVSKQDGKRLNLRRSASQNETHKRQLQKTTPIIRSDRARNDEPSKAPESGLVPPGNPGRPVEQATAQGQPTLAFKDVLQALQNHGTPYYFCTGADSQSVIRGWVAAGVTSADLEAAISRALSHKPGAIGPKYLDPIVKQVISEHRSPGAGNGQSNSGFNQGGYHRNSVHAFRSAAEDFLNDD